MSRPYKIEVCIENIQQGANAVLLGADQLELCANLELDGLTPDLQTAIQLRDMIEEVIPIKIMIRSRANDFIYTEGDIDEMINQIKQYQEHGFDRFVFGALTQKKSLDLKSIGKISKAVGDNGALCIHKAIDECADIITALHSLDQFENINEVLTSGGKATAIEGAYIIHEMIEQAPYGIDIIGAGKITKENIEKVNEIIGGPTYHGRRILY
jgi:copper homeostasis protein